MGRTVKVARGELVITEVTWKQSDGQAALIRRVMALLLRPPSITTLESAITVDSGESSVVHGDFDALPER